MNPKQAPRLVTQKTRGTPRSGEDAPTSRTLDDLRVIDRLPVAEWWGVLTRVVEARHVAGADWLQGDRDRVRELARTALRFTRPDGSVSFGPVGLVDDRIRSIRSMAAALDDAAIATVARWWFGKRGVSSLFEGPPPLPAFGDLQRPLAMLRADWGKTGEWLAVDARDPSVPRVELSIGGRPLVGPTWPGTLGPARMRLWTTSSTADCAEWSVGTGGARIVRTAILLRGRGLAILAQQGAPTSGDACSRIALGEDVTTRPIANSRVLTLKPGVAGSSACAIPLALNPEAGGSFVADDGVLSLTTPTDSRSRVWLPIVFSWAKDRARRIARWRHLTVSEKGRICPSDRAFAARVSWGLGDGLIVYRSLAKPASRTFLGYQTSARLLVGLFSAEGNVTPLLQVE